MNIVLNVLQDVRAREAYKELRESMLLEMARVGFIDDKYEVYIHTDDPGNIPHFHIWDTATRGNRFHTCIEITSPRYFNHTGKEDVLNSSMRKELMDFLRSKPKNKRYSSNWEYLVSMWNDNNSKVEVDEDQPLPDYTRLR